MSGRSKFEKTAEWATRIVLLPVGLFFLWAAVKQLLNAEPETSFAGAGGGLVLAGFVLYAAIYPAPPWRNEPLKTVLLVLFCMAALLLWWIGTMVLAILAVKHTVGENRLIVVLTFFGLLALPFLLTVVIQNWLHKRRASAAK